MVVSAKLKEKLKINSDIVDEWEIVLHDLYYLCEAGYISIISSRRDHFILNVYIPANPFKGQIHYKIPVSSL